MLWRKVAEKLKGEPFRLIIPDLVGLGFSSRPPMSAHTLDHHARWMGGLLRALELNDPLLVVQDWGGPIGVLGAVEAGLKPSGLVVLNTVLDAPREGFRPTPFHKFANAPIISDLAFRVFGFPQNALHKVQGDKKSIRGDVARAYKYPLRGLANNAAPLGTARMVPDSPAHPSVSGLTRCGEFVASLTCPSAVVWGTRDPVLGRALGRIKRLLPDAPVTETRAGHFLQEEVPGEIAEAVRLVAARGRSERD
ncbi:MAG: alpha/beta fold hydrolase [Deltaproteobacteria bacterium]|nr:alpha/beta fold hydrolase [Deltaproteobacteria bacterium]